MKKYLKIDKAIYEVDDRARTYKFINRNFNWAKLSEEENNNNKKSIEGYSRIVENKPVENINKEKLLDKLLKASPDELIKNLSSDNANIKFTSSKALIQLSEKNPEIIYKYYNNFVKLLENENNIIKWTGIIIIGNLAKIDKLNKTNQILLNLVDFFNVGKMITAGNTAEALTKIAIAKPKLADKITSELLKVKKYKYDTAECGNIAVGHVIDAFSYYLNDPDKKVIDFMKKETKNPRNSTAKKAQKYLEKIK